MIKRGSTEIANIKRGSTDIDKVTRGVSTVWERVTGPTFYEGDRIIKMTAYGTVRIDLWGDLQISYDEGETWYDKTTGDINIAVGGDVGNPVTVYLRQKVGGNTVTSIVFGDTNTTYTFISEIIEANLVNILDAAAMFAKIPNLKFASTLEELNIENATSVGSMFKNTTFTGGYIPPIRGRYATAVNDLFNGSNITELPIIYGFGSGSAIRAFQNCTSLIVADMSRVYHKFFSSTANMFDGCTNLTTVKSFYPGNSDNFSYMFRNCTSLVSGEPIYSNDPVNCDYTFENCTSLVTAPFLGFTMDTSAAIFKGCTLLECVPKIDNTAESSSNTEMFANCPAIVHPTAAEITALQLPNGSDYSYDCPNTVQHQIAHIQTIATGDWIYCNAINGDVQYSLDGGTNWIDLVQGATVSTALNAGVLDFYVRQKLGNEVCSQLDLDHPTNSNAEYTKVVSLNFLHISNASNILSSGNYSRTAIIEEIKNTLNINTAYQALADMEHLHTIPVGLKFRVDVNELFKGNKLLLKVEKLKLIPTASTTRYSINHMFDGCSVITDVDIVDTTFVDDFNNIFLNCALLETVSCFNTTNSASDFQNSSMYIGCVSLITPASSIQTLLQQSGGFNECLAEFNAPVIGTLSSSDLTSDSVKLSWTAATDDSGIDYYNLYKDGVFYQNVGNVLTVDVTGLTGLTEYDFKIKAVDIWDNESAFSNTVTVTTFDADTEPPIIGILSVSEVTTTTVSLAWTAATDNKGDVTNYEIYRDGVSLIVLGNVLLYENTGLTEDQTYTYKVRAKDGDGNWSSFSNEITATPTGIVLGLTDSLLSIPAQNLAAWTLRSIDVGIYIGKTVRLVIRGQKGSSYTGDVQIDDITLGTTFWDPETGINNFQRENATATVGSSYETRTWTDLTNGTSGIYWLRDSSGTTSSGTGNTSGNTGAYYYYIETSSGTTLANFWLRSPEIVIDSNVLTLYTAQNGATCMGLEIYLDIIS